MSSPRFAAADDYTLDTITVVADPEHPVGRDAVTAFLAACEADAAAHGGLVSVNRVRAALAGEGIPPRRLSALWGAFTGRGKPMRKATTDDTPTPWETIAGSGRVGKNDGKPLKLRVWVGGAQ